MFLKRFEFAYLPVSFSSLCFLFITVPIIQQFPFYPEDLIIQTSVESADGIIVLEGETRIRIDHGRELFDAHLSQLILLPGHHYLPNLEYLRSLIEANDSLEENLILLSGKSSTSEEAMATRLYFEKKGFFPKKLIIVTSGHHSFRSWFLFKQILPETEILSSPVLFPIHWYNPDYALEDPYSYYIFNTEQIKYLLYAFILRIPGIRQIYLTSLKNTCLRLETKT